MTVKIYPATRPALVWRVGLVFVAVTLIWLIIDQFVDAVLGAEYDRVTHTVRAVLISLLVIPLVVVARRQLDQRTWEGLGLSALREGWQPLLIGMACWLIPAGIGMAACVIFGWTEITLREPVGETLLLAVGLFILVFIYEALPEELIFRGYFYRNLADELPLWAAVVGQAGLFTFWGLLNGGANSIDRSLLFLTFSLVLGIFRAISGTVWTTIGFHLAFQTIAQLFGSIGDQFTLHRPEALQMVAFGMLPFAFGIPILKRFYHSTPNWYTTE